MTRVLVTGATGFVGRELCETLARCGYRVRAALRSDRAVPACIAEKVLVGEIGAFTDWSAALEGVDYVVHAAARVHVMNDAAVDLYFETNAHGTRHLATAAAHAGVTRFIFLSSVKVNGEETLGHAYLATDTPGPKDAYGQSKLAGEKSIQEIGTSTAMETVIVRPPLVYGPGVRANFLRLLRWVDRSRPLPLGSIENTRSLISIWNLADLLLRLLQHPAAPGKVWMASDGMDLSTPALIRTIAREMNRHVRLLPVHPGLLRLAGAMLGKKAEIGRLCGSLAVDIEPTRRELDWIPLVSVDESIARTVAWYLSDVSSHGR